MTNISINNQSSFEDDISSIRSVSFNYVGEKVYSAQMVEKICGIFISSPVIGDDEFIRWDEMTIDVEKVDDTDVYLYVRSAGSEDGLDSSSWNGPYLNDTTDISSQGGKYHRHL